MGEKQLNLHVSIDTNIGIVERRSDDASNLLSMGQLKNLNIGLLASVLYFYVPYQTFLIAGNWDVYQVWSEGGWYILTVCVCFDPVLPLLVHTTAAEPRMGYVQAGGFLLKYSHERRPAFVIVLGRQTSLVIATVF